MFSSVNLQQEVRLHEALDGGSRGLALLTYQHATLLFIRGRLPEAAQIAERSLRLAEAAFASERDQVTPLSFFWLCLLLEYAVTYICHSMHAQRSLRLAEAAFASERDQVPPLSLFWLCLLSEYAVTYICHSMHAQRSLRLAEAAFASERDQVSLFWPRWQSML